MADSFQLKALITGVDKLSPALKGIQKNIRSVQRQLSGLADGAVPFAAGFAASLALPIKLAMDFESAMADVKKVVDFDTPKQFQEMSDDVLGLSKRLPMAATDIAKIFAAGGQSGIARAELAAFAEDAIKMGVAFDMTADEAGQMMAQWRTAFRMGQDQVGDLADQINYLGNTGPANAKKISDIVTRIGSLGEVAGVIPSDIAAIGATIAGVGKEADVTSTGLKNFFLTLTAGKSVSGTQLKAYKFLKIDPAQLAKDMQKDSKTAILRVLKALKNVDKSKQSAVLSSLFGRESIDSISVLLNNIEQLEDNLGKVGDREKYLGSMAKEYSSRASTTANNLVLMTNNLKAMGITIGAILLPPLNDLLMQISPLIDHVTLFAKENPAMVQGLLAGAGALVALKLAAYGANTALSLIGNTAKMSPLGIFLRVATFGIAYLAANWDKYGPIIQAHMGEIKAVAALLTSYMLVFQWRWLKAAAVAGNAGPFMRGLGALKLLTGGVFGARTAFKLLWGVLRMNPLGILLTAIMLVIENWDEMTKGFDTAMAALREFLGLSKSAEKITADLNAGVAPQDALPAYTTGKLGQQGKPYTYGSSYQPGALAKNYNGGSTAAPVSGEMVVRFENAPQNLRVDEGKTSPGWSMSPDVGYSRYAK
ncbi:phage tail tape measure protein [Aeromonas jandaei]|uniref:phage tail tape measure protein n=1 Tax=Aeromonas jandaei TaxID=650 RepID=UPI003B9FFCF4